MTYRPPVCATTAATLLLGIASAGIAQDAPDPITTMLSICDGPATTEPWDTRITDAGWAALSAAPDHWPELFLPKLTFTPPSPGAIETSGGQFVAQIAASLNDPTALREKYPLQWTSPWQLFEVSPDIGLMVRPAETQLDTRVCQFAAKAPPGSALLGAIESHFTGAGADFNEADGVRMWSIGFFGLDAAPRSDTLANAHLIIASPMTTEGPDTHILLITSLSDPQATAQ